MNRRSIIVAGAIMLLGIGGWAGQAAGARSKFKLFDDVGHADSTFETAANHAKVAAFFAHHFGML